MAQQLVNGSYRKGGVTYTYRMSDRYAVVGEPLKGKHKKPQNAISKIKRRLHWKDRNMELTIGRIVNNDKA